MKKVTSSSRALTFIIAPLTILLGMGLLLFQAFSGSFFNTSNPDSDPSALQQQNTSPEKKERDFSQVKNDLLGIEFQVPSQFQQLPQQKIAKQNPNLLYGFQLTDNQQIQCFVSQTPRTDPQPVTWEYLAQGTFQEIKKNSPEANLENIREVKFSSNNSGAALKVTYPGPEEQTFLQWEVVGVNQSSAFFAFCQAPATISSTNQELLSNFLASFNIY